MESYSREDADSIILRVASLTASAMARSPPIALLGSAALSAARELPASFPLPVAGLLATCGESLAVPIRPAVRTLFAGGAGPTTRPVFPLFLPSASSESLSVPVAPRVLALFARGPSEASSSVAPLWLTTTRSEGLSVPPGCFVPAGLAGSSKQASGSVAPSGLRSAGHSRLTVPVVGWLVTLAAVDAREANRSGLPRYGHLLCVASLSLAPKKFVRAFRDRDGRNQVEAKGQVIRDLELGGRSDSHVEKSVSTKHLLKNLHHHLPWGLLPAPSHLLEHFLDNVLDRIDSVVLVIVPLVQVNRRVDLKDLNRGKVDVNTHHSVSVLRGHFLEATDADDGDVGPGRNGEGLSPKAQRKESHVPATLFDFRARELSLLAEKDGATPLIVISEQGHLRVASNSDCGSQLLGSNAQELCSRGLREPHARGALVVV